MKVFRIIYNYRYLIIYLICNFAILYRLTTVCQKKCIPPKYNDTELTKAQAVCLDRCVAKYMDIHERIGKKLTSISMQDEETMRKMQAQMGDKK